MPICFRKVRTEYRAVLSPASTSIVLPLGDTSSIQSPWPTSIIYTCSSGSGAGVGEAPGWARDGFCPEPGRLIFMSISGSFMSGRCIFEKSSLDKSILKRSRLPVSRHPSFIAMLTTRAKSAIRSSTTR